MKIAITLVTTAVLVISCSAQPLKTASFTVKVADEVGLPVSNATVSAGFYRNPKPGYGAGMIQHQVFEGYTDTNGLCAVSGQCHGSASFKAAKEGYYRSIFPKVLFRESSLTRWEPWNQQFEITLRKIENPIPMYAKTPHGMFMPALNIPVGYDLEKGDWLPPYGKGETSDFVIHASCEFGEALPSKTQAYDATVTITFSNDGDGVVDYVETHQEESVFHLPRHAPESGYTNMWTLRQFRNKEKSSFATTRRNEGLNQFFRVRTKKDKDGNIISAHYGKIPGGLWFAVASGKVWPMIKYYFNPNPNDRNMEFDPNQNLFTNLTLTERVNDP